MKRTIVLVLMAMALTSARAGVVINETNFPDEGLRYELLNNQDDGDGVLSDDEIAVIEQLQLSSPTSLKGLEYLKAIVHLDIFTDGSDDSPSNAITEFNGSILPHLFYLGLGGMNGLQKIDLSKNSEFGQLNIYQGAKNLEILSLPAGVESISLNGTPKLTSFDVSTFTKLIVFTMSQTGIEDLDFSGHSQLQTVTIGGEDKVQILNSLNLENCINMENVDIRNTTIKKLTMKHLPTVRTLMMLDNDITTITIDDCEVFNDITCNNNVLGTLYVKDNPQLHVISCFDNQLKVLIADNCPQLSDVKAYNNRLMWLDLKDVVKPDNLDESVLKLDNQQPIVQAVKISPTETGILYPHDRFELSRVKNLTAKGLAQTPRETTVDGIHYFVFYDDGPDTPNLVGSECGYVYETQWPFPWMQGNSKDNNLPVTLKVTSWTKHQAFLKLSASTVRGKYAEPAPAAPTVTRSQDYDGKITFKSSNENVVKVNAETGELTVIGAGTATITVSGEETDYRLAPTTSYTVIIDKASPVFSFANRSFETTYGGDPIPANALDIQMYDGTVVYTASPDSVATVDSNGKVTIVGAGTATIYATGPETSNCYRAQTTYTVLVNKAHTTFAFQIDSIAVNVGDSLKLNQLNVGVYDGVVVYTSSDDSIASVSADGYVKANYPGEVIITASGAETYNCFEATSAQYKLTIVISGASVNRVGVDASGSAMYDLLGRRIEGQPVRKGIYIKDGKKILVE